MGSPDPAVLELADGLPVTLGEAIARKLPRLRAEAESMMVDTCRVTHTATGTWVGGVFTPGATSTIYQGRCRLRRPAAAPQVTEAGETTWAVDTLVLSLPMAAGPDDTGDPAAVADGHDVEMLTSPNDPAKVGLALNVTSGHWQTDSTARRLPVKVVTRNA